jgi:hypothetical protein
MSGYTVNVYDCAGEYHSVEVSDFAAALARYGEFSSKYTGKFVQVFNLDRCDYNADGLTEDERDAIETEDANRAAFKAVGR